jgi:hypothetical protein
MDISEITIGDKFGKWTVIDVDQKHHGYTSFLCRCSCRNQTEKCIPATYLISEKSKSCGCANTTHGMSLTKVYSAWKSLHARKRAGIHVSKRWLSSFEEFYKDMGDPPTSEHLLGRKNTNLQFNKQNCEWITKVEQCRRKRNNKHIEYQGETKPLVTWCEQFDLDYLEIKKRISDGWSVHEAFKTPTSKYFYGTKHGNKYITGEAFEEIYRNMTIYIVTPDKKVCFVKKIRTFALETHIKEVTIYAALTKRAKKICEVKAAPFLDGKWFICSINGRSATLSKKVKDVAELVAKMDLETFKQCPISATQHGSLSSISSMSNPAGPQHASPMGV